MVPEQITHEVVIKAPIERVWALLTRAEGLGAWFADGGAEIDLTPGGAITLRWQEYGVFHAVVKRVDPPHAFAFRWAITSGRQPTPGNSTQVEFLLTPVDSGVRLRVVERGFDTLSLTPQAQAIHAAENTKGWEMELAEIRELAEHEAN